MATCPKCGAKVADDAKFCGACGGTVEPTAGGPAAPTAASSPASPSSAGAQGGMAPNVAALLVYIPVCLIGIVCAILFAFILEPYKNNRYIRFHAWQSLALHVCLIVIGVGSWIIAAVLTAIIHLFAILFLLIYLGIGVGGLGLAVFMMIKANGMETYKLPIIGDWAEKQANS